MKDITAFLNMGGYAPFVWPALGIAKVILSGMAIVSLRRLRQSEVALRAAETASPTRRRRSDAGASS